MTATEHPAPPATTPPPDPPHARPGLWHRAPGWLFHAVAAVGAAGLLLSDSYPTGGFMPLLFGFWVLLGCAALWLARLVAYLAGRSRHRSGPAWPFAVAPVAGVLVVAIAASGFPLQARWGLSEGAFDARADALVARVEAGEAKPGSNLIRNDRVALYTVAFAHVDEDGNVFFSIEGSGFIDGGGFARFPDGPPEPSDLHESEYQHLGGDWYTYVEFF